MQSFFDRKFGSILSIIWIAACITLLTMRLDSIVNMRFVDPDDQMRIVQIRDWMAGQSWWDITQYRMNPPYGGPMHWSRLVDVPIAGMILLFGLFTGRETAEMLACAAIPLLTLGAAMWIYARLGRRLFGSGAGLLAAGMLITIVPVMSQLVPMRIDHHGWQIVLFFAAFAALFDREAPRRAGIILGLSCALWMEISIEGLPFAILLLGILALRWVSPWPRHDYTQADTAFAWSALSIAGGSALFYTITESWASPQHCDSLSPFHVATLAAVALVVAGGIYAAKAKSLALNWPARLALCALGGAAGLATLFATAPQCGGDTFGALDPLVRDYWYNRVPEGLPLWQIAAAFSANSWAGIAAGAIALVYLLLAKRPESIADRLAIALLFVGTAAIGMLVSRVALYAISIANIMLAPLFLDIMKRAEMLGRFATRTGLRVVAVMLIMPAVLANYVVGVSFEREMAADPKAKAEDALFDKLTRQCQKPSAARALSALPEGAQLMVGLDTAPAVLVFTDLKIVASGHHRNQAAMADVIRAFIGSAADARKIYKARGVDFLVTCEGSYELQIYYNRAPNGFGSQVRSGDLPEWLIKERNIGAFSVYRVDWSRERLR
jgi:hypothetical protein